MKPFKNSGGPATKARPYLTALGGVYAYPTNPFSWGVDPCLGCFPFPHKHDDAEVSEQYEDGPPPSIWNPGGPPAPFAGGQGQLTSGGGGSSPAPASAPAPTSSTPTTTTAPATSTTTTTRYIGWGSK